MNRDWIQSIAPAWPLKLIPIGSEMLQSIDHADGLVTILEDPATGLLLGAAALGRGAGTTAYSYIAATAPGHEQRGLGMLLKLQQRDWCLARGITSMRWTFDPLVGRNGRFNLTKLGATASRYELEFYGVMSDQLNGNDPADRLLAEWNLIERPDGRAEPPAPADERRAGAAEVAPHDLAILVRGLEAAHGGVDHLHERRGAAAPGRTTNSPVTRAPPGVSWKSTSTSR